MTDKARIALAEAMGSEWVEILSNGNLVSKRRPYYAQPWNPSENADDDCSVKDWLNESGNWEAADREIETDWLDRALQCGAEMGPCNYQIGDYFSAACKGLGIGK